MAIGGGGATGRGRRRPRGFRPVIWKISLRKEAHRCCGRRCVSATLKGHSLPLPGETYDPVPAAGRPAFGAKGFNVVKTLHRRTNAVRGSASKRLPVEGKAAKGVVAGRPSSISQTGQYSSSQRSRTVCRGSIVGSPLVSQRE